MSKIPIIRSPVRDRGARIVGGPDHQIGPKATWPRPVTSDRLAPPRPIVSRFPRRAAITGNELTGERRLPNEFDENKLSCWLLQAGGGLESETASAMPREHAYQGNLTQKLVEMTMPRVLIGPYLLRNQPGRFREILKEAGFELIDPVGDFALTTDQLRPHLAAIDALIAGGERMTPDLFKAAPKLRVIARTGVGYDLIDVDAATAHRVAVTITPGTNQESVAEQTWALLLALARRIVPNDRVIHDGGWDRALVAPVRGMTLGLVGMGRIGRAVAMRADAFRVRVVAFDTLLDAEFDKSHGIDRLSLDDLLASSDVVSLHVPLTVMTRGMVNRDFLAKMQRGSYLINTSRGGLVIENDLRDALRSGQLAGAGLDVLNHEPPEPGNPLLGLPNVILSPHIAGTDTQSMREMADLAASTIVELYRNQWPVDCVVNSELRGGWRW
jgi:D-3-phosphoglycerate dehydrogenase / 2-oxoglutarate reductase